MKCENSSFLDKHTCLYYYKNINKFNSDNRKLKEMINNREFC